MSIKKTCIIKISRQIKHCHYITVLHFNLVTAAQTGSVGTDVPQPKPVSATDNILTGSNGTKISIVFGEIGKQTVTIILIRHNV